MQNKEYFHLKHCNPLQRNYRVELLHREIPVVIIGNEFTEYNFFFCFGCIYFPVLIKDLLIALWADWKVFSFDTIEIVAQNSSCNVYKKLPTHTKGFEGLL